MIYDKFTFDKTDLEIKVVFQNGVHDYFKTLESSFFGLESQNLRESTLKTHQVKSFAFGEVDSALKFGVALNSDLEEAELFITMQHPTYLNQTHENVVRRYRDSQKIESVARYSYSNNGVENAKTLAQGIGFGAKIITFLGFAISFKLALALLKLFQMLEFLTLFSIRYPDNVKAFLNIFNYANPLNVLPNPFKFMKLYNDHCEEQEIRYISEDIDCQILQNSGGLIGVVFMVVILKGILQTLNKFVLRKESKLKTKITKMSKEMTSISKAVESIGGVHLDIYLSLMTNFNRYKKGDSIADLNLFISMTSVLFLIYMLLFFLFKTSKVIEA